MSPLSVLGGAGAGLVGSLTSGVAQKGAQEEAQEQARKQALLQMQQNLSSGQIGGPAIASPKPEGQSPLAALGGMAEGAAGAAVTGALADRAKKEARGEKLEDESPFLSMARGYLGR